MDNFNTICVLKEKNTEILANIKTMFLLSRKYKKNIITMFSLGLNTNTGTVTNIQTPRVL